MRFAAQVAVGLQEGRTGIALLHRVSKCEPDRLQQARNPGSVSIAVQLFITFSLEITRCDIVYLTNERRACLSVPMTSLLPMHFERWPLIGSHIQSKASMM